MIEWFARNAVAANLLMLTMVLVGLLSASRLIPLEVFPSFERQLVVVETQLRGATPHSVEDGITTRIEEAIFDLEGVEKIESRSSEGSSTVIATIGEDYDKRELLNEIKLRVDSLNTLPDAAENPVSRLSVRNAGVLQVAVHGNHDLKTLRTAAQQVREDFLRHPEITLVELLGVTNYEIGIEVEPQVLDDYQLTLASIVDAIRQGSADITAGNIQTRDGDILVRANAQAKNQPDFAAIAIITPLGAKPILLGDIATINDGFEEQPIVRKFAGENAIMLDVLRTGNQSAITIAKVVRDYIVEQNAQRTDGITISYWDDDSELLKARISTLFNSGLFGGILVLLILSLFLRPAVAFWVFLGIPVSFMGAFIFMPFVDGTFNIMSLFAFITVLGIVVDDAIVTGENIFRKMHDNFDPIEASIIGTKEIAVPVTFGILTTIVAFYPLFTLGANRTGFLAAQIPMVVIPVLLFSLIESKLVLPAHLSHVKPRTPEQRNKPFSRLQIAVANSFEQSIMRYYAPLLARCLQNKSITITALLSVSAIIVAIASTGHLKYTQVPRVESERITINLIMPDTTGFATTQQHIERITDIVFAKQKKYTDPDTGISIIRETFSTTGSQGGTVKPSVGRVSVELIGPEKRHIKLRTSQLAREIRKEIGNIAGAQSLSLHAELGRGGEPIDVELSGTNQADMRAVGDALRLKLMEFPNVFDIQDNYSGGKEEININLKPLAYSLGLDLSDIANQVRASVFGIQAQRIQRGREEVRVMVRLPLAYRSSIDDLLQLPIYLHPGSTPIPLSDLATLTSGNSPTTLFRFNRARIIKVSADVDKQNADVPAILKELRQFLNQQIAQKNGVTFAFKGEAEEQAENNTGIQTGLVTILISIYVLLAIPFRSYLQPFIVMSIIPFSAIGAVVGHMLLFKDISMLSIVGMMALLGVVVNDSLVLVDYINKQRAKGVAVFDAVLASGAARFRPVILTSITTFAGLMPLLFDPSTHVEFLKPMAISLGFGILFATAITLIIVPVNYLIAYNAKRWLVTKFSPPHKPVSHV